MANKPMGKPRVTISSSIPLEIWEEARANNWKWQDIIICGMINKRGMPELLERVRELEANNQSLTTKLSNYAQKYWELDQKIKDNGVKSNGSK